MEIEAGRMRVLLVQPFDAARQSPSAAGAR